MNGSLPEVHSSRLDGRSKQVATGSGFLARHEGDFKAEAELRMGIGELLCDPATGLSERQRQDAIVCYLTRSEGWQDAFKLLGGAFAPDPKVRQS